ncbi:unnamed protein product [Ceutorhynchus assimilis]|uniref:Fork-head domain-containing protein n=1 Tax=Ceutorhynchus assimilis TaxID=467358 RepID=A0A9N9MAW7_9CUCU|nr:unnamed protein product [Ceutorhynchus assimilis]
MSTSMDIFLNGPDFIPIPESLEMGMISEMDSLLGSQNDFSGFNFNSLELEEFSDARDYRWFNTNSNHSIFDLNGDDGPTMVNPNAVLPLMSTRGRSPSPALRESHLTFSPATIKISSLKADAVAVKQDLLNRFDGSKKVVKKTMIPINLPPIIKSVAKVPILAKSGFKPIGIKGQTGQTLGHSVIIKNGIGETSRSMSIQTHAKKVPVQKPTLDIDDENFLYPKPAYSYSCLIAMALKNSRSGSLPVSEIYNFMCKHFPYFKTAPKAWKNSVRHNLSLNKCFEKIEKPAVNGAQRKGCLWGMNPDKINKMDEEVQKWSRKDPMSIKKAMVYPETLEALERGELKFACACTDEEGENYIDSSAAESDSDDSQEERLAWSQVPIEFESQDLIEYDEFNSGQTDDDLEDDKRVVRLRMGLPQKELDYEKTINNKRRKTHIVLNQ